MKGQRSGKCLALCMLAWSCLHFAWSDAISSGATFTGAGSIGRGFPSDVTNRTAVCGNLSVQCVMLLPPPYGSYYIEKGTGLSLGSVIVYWCREGYQLVGSKKLACLLRDNTSYWSHPAPHCEAIPKPLDKGFRVAVIASLISGVIILTMSVSFAACCLRDRLLRNSAQRLNTREEQQQGRTCWGARQADSTNKEMEKQQGAFGKLKHHHRLDYRISALRSSVYPGALAGCSNQGFQRCKCFYAPPIISVP
ncbi:sushi domain-containing protein 3-like [Natator depressus]|uniref:sushi domain-containing protein 3-like n=1 Tax=Natator depressus TaxID=27790 RepID=UPI003EB7B97A